MRDATHIELQIKGYSWEIRLQEQSLLKEKNEILKPIIRKHIDFLIKCKKMLENDLETV